MLTIRILFEDQHLIVLSKPAGLLSQGEITGDKNLVDDLRTYFGRNYVGLIHRLDRNTSGLMLVAKRSKSAQRLTESLQDGKIYRSYLAWLIGKLPQPTVWTHRLLKNPNTNRVQVTQSTQGKVATLSAKPISYSEWKGTPVTLAEFILETGRSHQIRAQSSHEGYPVLGDFKYQTNKHSPVFPRTALHSFQIKFPHPMSQEEMKFEDPLPEDLSQISRLNIQPFK